MNSCQFIGAELARLFPLKRQKGHGLIAIDNGDSYMRLNTGSLIMLYA
jgi:hypothetical protein